MLEIFKKLKSGPVSAAALREARAALDLFIVETLVQKRDQARREAILSGDPKEIARAEAALADARMELERVEIAVQELESRIAEADRREADEAVAAQIHEIETRRDALRRRIVKEAAPAMRTLCEIMASIDALDAEIATLNAGLATDGRAERVALSEEGFTPVPEGAYAGVWALASTVTIRPVSQWGVPGFNWSAIAPA